MMKKVLSIICLGLMVIMTACSKNSGNEGIKDNNADKKLEKIGKNIEFNPNKLVNGGDPINLEYWTWVDNDPAIEMAKKYEKIYPNVKIKIVIQPWDDMWTKLPLALKGKDGPAIFNVHNSQHDLLLPYLASYDIDIEKLKEDYSSVEPHIIQGKVYYIDSVINTGNIYYNKKLWEEAGLNDADIPKTWEEFINVAKKLTKKDSNGKIIQAGFNYNGSGGYDGIIYGLNYQKGEVMFNDAGDKVEYDNDITIENTNFLIDLYEKHGVGSKDFGTDSTMSFGNEQTAMVYKWGWMVSELENKYPSVEYGVFGTPTPTEKTPFAYDRYNGESTPGINKNQTDEQQEVAQDFLKYILANDNYSRDAALTYASFPTKKSLETDEELLDIPVLKVISERMERLIWPGPFPSTIETSAQQVIENILFNNVNVEKAVKDGQEKMDKDMKGTDFISVENKYQFYNERHQ